MTGIPPINPLKTIQCAPIFYINLGISDNENSIWDFSKLFNIQYVGSNLIISAFFLLMYINYYMYFKKKIKKIKITKIRYSKRSSRGINAKNKKAKLLKIFISKLFLITFLKCLLMTVIYLAIKQKHSPIHKHKP